LEPYPGFFLALKAGFLPNNKLVEGYMDNKGFNIVNVYAEGREIRAYRTLRCLSCNGILQVEIVRGDDTHEVFVLDGHCKGCKVVDFTDD
jgi:phage FluMu protein Com